MSAVAHARSAGIAPGPFGNPVLGSLIEIGRDPLAFLTEAHEAYGDVVRFRFGLPGRRVVAHLVAHPDGVEHVLHRNNRNYRRAPTYDVLALYLGRSLLTADGERWVRSRRALQPAFQRERLYAQAPRMTDVAAGVAERWETMARSGAPVDVAREMMGLTLQILARVMLSTTLEQEIEVVGRALPVIMDHSIRKMTLRAPFPLSWPTPDNLRARRALADLDRVVHGLITSRRRPGADGFGDDVLGLLLKAQAEGVEGMDGRQLRNEVLTILLAGHETTAVALTWTWALLARHPDAELALHRELDRVLGDRLPTVADLPALETTRRILMESLRLYPPAYMVERLSVEEDAALGWSLPAGSVVMTSPWITHRSPRYWDDPLVFDPDRFAPDRSEGRHPYAWFAFGGGPRRCIGEQFALLEARLVLATLARRFRVQPLEEGPPEPEPLVTLRPRGGLTSRLERR